MPEFDFKNLVTKIGIFKGNQGRKSGFSKIKMTSITRFFYQHFTYLYSILHIFTNY